jgi:hypothetical protein
MITIASPDKISLSMYTDFLMRNLGGGYRTGYSHYLMTDEGLSLYLNEFSKAHEKCLIRFYANKRLTDPAVAVPAKLVEMSSSVVWLALYSTDAIIVKDEGGAIAALSDSWKATVTRLGG